MKKLRLILLAILGAVLLPLALPNDIFKTGNPLIGLFCLVPFLYAVCKASSWKFAVILGMIFGAVSTFLTYYWLMFFREYAIWTIGGVVFAYTVFNAVLALFLYIYNRVFPARRVFVLAFVWTVYEFLKSTGFLGFPWGLMAHPFHMLKPLIQVADLTGVWGVSFLVILVNTFITETLFYLPEWPFTGKNAPKRKKWLSEGAVMLGLILAAFVYGTIRIRIPIPAEKQLSLLLIQQNRDPWQPGAREETILEGEALTEEGIQAATGKPDIIVWSETSFPDFLMDWPFRYENHPAANPFLPFIKQQNSYFLLGAPKLVDPVGRDAMNAVLLFSPTAEALTYYGKQHPVPFAESLPLWEYKFARDFYSNIVGLSGQWTMGRESTVFEIVLAGGKTLTFSTPICFEDAFPDLNRRFILAGADLWINLTNVSWSQRESAEIQMYVASLFRAVENRRVLIRATNSGLTCVIDPFGRIIKQLPLFKPGFLYLELPVSRDKSFSLYTAAGDYFPILLLIILLAALIIHKTGLVKRLKKRNSGADNGHSPEKGTDNLPQDNEIL